ncbi:MAG: hypothetical protein WBP45_03915 [Daejeonella sp.]
MDIKAENATKGSWGHEPWRRETGIDEFGFLKNIYQVFDGD